MSSTSFEVESVTNNSQSLESNVEIEGEMETSDNRRQSAALDLDGTHSGEQKNHMGARLMLNQKDHKSANLTSHSLGQNDQNVKEEAPPLPDVKGNPD